MKLGKVTYTLEAEERKKRRKEKKVEWKRSSVEGRKRYRIQ